MEENIDDDLEWLIDDDAEVPEADDKVTGAKKGEELSPTEEEKSPRDSPTETFSDTYTDDDDDGDDGLTPAERELLERNTLLNDVSDREAYDLKNKVEKANADLEKISDLDSSREKRVMFKHKLVDVEAQPPDYSSDSSSSSSSDSEDERRTDSSKKTDKKGDSDKRVNKFGEDKEILVERGGKFQLISGASSANRATSSSSSSSDDDRGTGDNKAQASVKSVFPTVSRGDAMKNRPSSAPMSPSKRISDNTATPRPGSASRSSEYSHLKSPYAMSSEMKELMRKRAAARAAREEEERAQEQAKQEENRQNAEHAWKCWLEKKDEEMRERKRLEDERKPTDDKHNSKQEAEEAYQLWLSEKRKQTKKHRIQTQQHQLEIDEGWFRRDRKECDKAYKRWLRQKNNEARSQRAHERQSGQQTRADAYRMRKLKRLLLSIQNSQQYSY